MVREKEMLQGVTAMIGDTVTANVHLRLLLIQLPIERAQPAQPSA